MTANLIRPIMTEKSLKLASQGWYTFQVNPTSNKAQIGHEIEQLYKVKVMQVRTMTVHGKVRRVGKKLRSVIKSNWKKALIRLQEGQSLEIFESTPEGGKV